MYEKYTNSVDRVHTTEKHVWQKIAMGSNVEIKNDVVLYLLYIFYVTHLYISCL